MTPAAVLLTSLEILQERSLESNPMARARFERRQGPEPVGLVGPVGLHATRPDAARSASASQTR